MPTLGQLIDRNADRFGDLDAYVELERRRSWRELGARTDALAYALRGLNIRKGDRVGVILSDCIEVVETIGACAKAGAIRVGLNYRLAPREIGELIDDSGADVLVVQDSKVAIAQEALIFSKRQPKLIAIGTHELELDYESLISAELDRGAFAHTPHEQLMICYTTGSTGLPKGAIYPHELMMESMAAVALAEGAGPDDVWLHAMPASGVPIMHLLRNLFHGTKCAIIGEWNVETALTLIDREQATICVLVPTMLNDLLSSGLITKFNCSSIRQLGYGSAPIPPATVRDALKAFGCEFLQMFGTTELVGMGMMLTATDHERALKDGHNCLESAGRPLYYVDVRVVDDAGNDLPDGEAGELLIHSPYVIPGYWNQAVEYSETVRDGWLHTGDIAVIDAEGFVHLKDRAKFRIKSGGYNVFPVEVENCLAEHDAVDEVSVVGLPDPKWGDRIHAVVTLSSGSVVTGAELREYCRGKIANFKIPKEIEIWETLPKGPTGKIQKREIIEICSQASQSGAA
ncbi:class I adenylate-forming enzyme family protein [Ruegeria arenilitoris]|uniref:class I adenylate-forming enzyme family protein n=1 Tax=Ruegeria arenilitoris TaxID=1173585 RepID=UPI00147A3025|nr:AMP-binding protein [Ruegeria arenilitoris]